MLGHQVWNIYHPHSGAAGNICYRLETRSTDPSRSIFPTILEYRLQILGFQHFLPHRNQSLPVPFPYLLLLALRRYPTPSAARL